MKFKDYIKVNWTKPDFKDEAGEYFENEPTKDYLKSKDIEFKTEKELFDFLQKGKMTQISAKELSKNYENLSLTDAEFKDDMKDPAYAKSYNSMEKELEDRGTITLPSPIILKVGTTATYYGFAGNRRINFAINNNLPLTVWLR